MIDARAPDALALALARATQSTAIGVVLSSNGHVAASITPVTGRPASAWNALTASAVPCP